MELVDELMEKMSMYRVTPSALTMGIVVKMFGRRHKLQEAFAVVRDWPKKYGLIAGSSVKNCLFFACLHNEATYEACQVFDDLRTTKCRVDRKMFAALIKNCARVGQVNKAVQLIDDAYGLSSGKRELPFGEHLENSCLEHVMRSLWKRGKFQRYGGPLIRKMLEAKVPLSSEIMAYSQQGQDWSWSCESNQEMPCEMQYLGWHSPCFEYNTIYER
jgi:hypothetical protein